MDGSPSLRTVHAVFPHAALRSVGSSVGLSETKMGLSQTIKTCLRKEGIRPRTVGIPKGRCEFGSPGWGIHTRRTA